MKKYLSIFLIFFLLFSIVSPAFAAESSDILPPILDSSYDSYIVSVEDFYTNGSIYYMCYMYNSDDWQSFCYTDTSLVRLISFVDNPSPIYQGRILSTDYNPNNNNNGWGSLKVATGVNEGQSSNGGVYFQKSVSGYISTSNRDVPFADLNKTTNSLDYNGEFFFTLTPPLVVETTKALTLFQNQTLQTILTIALCGVGCLALLISLVLLRKVLIRFLNK